jgi:nucleoside-diphosphate-sugar epimerase
MKIFVAGATGVIGRSLVPLLVDAGHEVIGMTSDASKRKALRSMGARPVVVDVFDLNRLMAALRKERPDAVVHQLTSLRTADYDANKRIRMQGTRNLVDAAQAAGVKRVVAQSYCLYAPGPGLAVEKDALESPSGHYGGSVEGIQALERAVGSMEEGVILRYGTLYGPGTWFARDGAIAGQMRRGEFTSNGDITSFVYVGDAARAAVLALAWPAGIVNIVDNEPASAREWPDFRPRE